MEKKRVTIIIDQDVYDKIKVEGEAQNRNFNNYINIILNKLYKDNKEKGE